MKRSLLAVVLCIACLAVGGCDQNKKQQPASTNAGQQGQAPSSDAAAARELAPLLNAIAAHQRDIQRLAVLTLLRVRLQEITPNDVEPRFDTDLHALLQGGEVARNQLANDLKQGVGRYLDRVESLARNEANWPKDKPANIYAGMAAVKLAMLRKNLDNALNAGRVPIASLREVERVVGWAGGYANGLPASQPSDFAKYDALVERAAPVLIPVNRVQRPGSNASTGVVAGSSNGVGPASKTVLLGIETSPEPSSKTAVGPSSARSAAPEMPASPTIVARAVWLLRGMPGQICKTEQWSDGTFIVTTSKGVQGRGRMLGDRAFTVDLPFAKNVVGKISADGRRIDWPNGSYWQFSKTQTN